MAKYKGNFSHLTEQDLYWDGIDEDSKRYGIENFERDIRNEIHKEKKRYKEFIEDTSDDWALNMMRGNVEPIL